MLFVPDELRKRECWYLEDEFYVSSLDNNSYIYMSSLEAQRNDPEAIEPGGEKELIAYLTRLCYKAVVCTKGLG